MTQTVGAGRMAFWLARMSLKPAFDSRSFKPDTNASTSSGGTAEIGCSTTASSPPAFRTRELPVIPLSNPTTGERNSR